MKRNTLWIVEASSPSSWRKKWNPCLNYAPGTAAAVVGYHLTRAAARAAAKQMQATNPLNHPRFPLHVIYRATRYTADAARSAAARTRSTP